MYYNIPQGDFQYIMRLEFYVKTLLSLEFHFSLDIWPAMMI